MKRVAKVLAGLFAVVLLAGCAGDKISISGSPPVHIKGIPISKGITNFTLISTSTNPGGDSRFYEMAFSPRD
jgi:uncharacterized lipoprotein YajG